MLVASFQHADTFVAFMDIAGFKSMMGDGQRAPLERESDELVYAFYGLTPEEIKIVEGAK